MGLAFGTEDTIECLGNVQLPGADGETLCLASKVSLHFFGAGVYVSDGYVLKITAGPVGSVGKFYPLPSATIESLQHDGLLPTPLPPYQVSLFQYALGYSLWLVIVGVLLATFFKKLFGKLEPFLRADVAPVTGPPMIRTDDDKWLASLGQTLLEPNERVQHQAFGASAEDSSAKPRAVLLTDRRLLIVDVIPKFRGRPQVGDTRIFSREDIVGVGQESLVLSFYVEGGHFNLFVRGSQRGFTNQWLFARDVPKLLGRD